MSNYTEISLQAPTQIIYMGNAAGCPSAVETIEGPYELNTLEDFIN
jgi:hypothetical protein